MDVDIAARGKYSENFTSEVINYQQLMAVFQGLIR